MTSVHWFFIGLIVAVVILTYFEYKSLSKPNWWYDDDDPF